MTACAPAQARTSGPIGTGAEALGAAPGRWAAEDPELQPPSSSRPAAAIIPARARTPLLFMAPPHLLDTMVGDGTGENLVTGQVTGSEPGEQVRLQAVLVERAALTLGDPVELVAPRG